MSATICGNNFRIQKNGYHEVIQQDLALKEEGRNFSFFAATGYLPGVVRAGIAVSLYNLLS